MDHSRQSILILTTLPMIFAIFLNHKLMKDSTLIRAAIFIPALTSVIVTDTIFRMILGDSDGALANQVLSFIGLSPIEWRYGVGSGMFLMVTLASWRWMGG
ncbi:hypothetical protein [Salipaludibacillus neizhouensis]|uniref:hypothetical protein n=1 Tax=Salipaludibacillus neizhouensis TaxID=885475 RepID=UPI0026A3576F|nr:hypothetical protein [Salipaludibacillus neizhouensis]